MSKVKNYYSDMERILIEGVKILEDTTTALELDLMLLEMEEKQGLMDGVELQEWIL